MRGKLRELWYVLYHVRIIPAHAGQTKRSLFISPPLPDHPRACGANIFGGAVDIGKNGSSPRMRGKRRRAEQAGDAVRIIPAHAGQTPNRGNRNGWVSDHPRACGANEFGGLRRGREPGSSPRMRGKLDVARVRVEPRRIIPAHAGQTIVLPFLCWLFSDHPRACGANFLREQAQFLRGGSSPRMRGKHDDGSELFGDKRIIPAHAGQTRRGSMGAVIRSDHPRACGANTGSWSAATSVSGSSPRMRGKHE